MNWVLKTENTIFTIIEKRATNALKSKYPKIRFTLNGEPDGTESAFPTIYIKFLPVAEMGKTLDGTQINMIMTTIQVKIITSKTQGQTVCREIAWDIIEQFKKLLFEVSLSPEILKTNDDTHQIVFRVKRLIGGNDIIK